MAAEANAPTPEELAAAAHRLVLVGRAIYASLHEAGPLGAPESVIHLAIAEHGLPTWVVAGYFIDGLGEAGVLVRSNHRLVARQP